METFNFMDKKKEAGCGSCDVTESAEATFTALAEPTSKHTDHSHSKKRLNRVKGQLEAISRMIDDGKYCPEIIQQITAATNALRALNAEVLERHLRGCVKAAFQSKDPFDMNEKIEEIVKIVF